MTKESLDTHIQPEPVLKEQEPRSDQINPARRSFFTGVALASAAAALAPAAAQAAQPAAASPGAIKAPKGLGPRAAMDNRFAETYEVPVPIACKIITEFFAALTRRDLKAMASYLHFPFISWERTDCVRVNTVEEFMAKTPASMNISMKPERFTDHDGYMMPGCYETFGGLEVLCMDPVLVGLSMHYMRYDDHGRKLHKCEGMYAITNNDGRWAIQGMSTIFTPADMIGIEYPDAVDAANRLRIDHDLAYQHSDRRFEPLRGEGPSGSVANYAGQPWSLAPNGRAMEQFQIAGVKTRIRYSDGSEPPRRVEPSANPLQDYAGYRELFPKSGVGNWGWVIGKLPNTRVLHVCGDKVHIFTGAIRFTTSGEEASHNTNLGIVTYQRGRWAGEGSLAYTTPHDRSNDMLRS